MSEGQVIVLGALAVVLIICAIWAGTMFKRAQPGGAKPGAQKQGGKLAPKAQTELAEEDINHLFNQDFREELRNRGRLRFENIVNENAMFLKQDLDITIAQLNEYIKKVIEKKLDEEFAAYSKAMKDAQELAISTLQKSASAVDEQRAEMKAAMQKHTEEREASLIKAYEENMAQIIEHYLLETLGQQFDLRAQMPYILSQMELNKADMVEDLRL
jgi:hypothetical protein